jgi:Domain of unknown function (DUF397)
MDDRAWRISSYSGGQGNCIEVVGHGNRVLVRDTKERTGPVLRFSPNAWRRFAAQVKRSLAGPQPGLQGHPCARGAPSACPGLFPARLMRGQAPGCRRGGVLDSVVAGSERYGVGCGARSAPLAGGRAGGSGGTGNRGNRAWGFPGFPWRRADRDPPATTGYGTVLGRAIADKCPSRPGCSACRLVIQARVTV